MARVYAFIDGFNLYHALDEDPSLRKFKWLNLHSLAQHFTRSTDNLKRVYYFTAYAYWSKKKVAKHKRYVKALRSVGVEPVFGAFRFRKKRFRGCRKIHKYHEEKRTDVNIAVTLLGTALDDKWDKALIISGDMDLVPAIQAVKTRRPKAGIVVATPPGRHSTDLQKECGYYTGINAKDLQANQLPDPVRIGSVNLTCPGTWK